MRNVVEAAITNSIPAVSGNKSFNNLDSINYCQVIHEANPKSFVKAVNGRIGLLPRTIQLTQNLCAPNPGNIEE